MEHVLHFRASECRWLLLAHDFKLDPLEGLEIERLAVTQVVSARVKSTIDDQPITQDRSTVIPAARFNTIQISGYHLLPFVRHQVVEVYFTVDRSISSIDKTSSITGPAINAKVVLVWHHDVV